MGRALALGAPPGAGCGRGFRRSVVVVVSLGSIGSGGYAVDVEAVTWRADGVEVALRRTVPGPTCGTTAAFTTPGTVVRLGAIPRPVRFTERAVVHRCG